MEDKNNTLVENSEVSEETGKSPAAEKTEQIGGEPRTGGRKPGRKLLWGLLLLVLVLALLTAAASLFSSYYTKLNYRTAEEDGMLADPQPDEGQIAAPGEEPEEIPPEEQGQEQEESAPSAQTPGTAEEAQPTSEPVQTAKPQPTG